MKRPSTRFVLGASLAMLVFTGCMRQHEFVIILGCIQRQEIREMPKLLCEAREALDICEAVFRYQFKNNAAHGETHLSPYLCFVISMFGHEPPPGFLNRFKDYPIPVIKRSDRAPANSQDFVISDSISFSITKIRYLDEYTVDVDAKFNEGPLSASGNEYRVVRKNGKWEVIKDSLKWIS